MASSSFVIVLTLLLSVIFLPAAAGTRAIVLPTVKDSASGLHIAHFNSPAYPILVDLNGPLFSVTCQNSTSQFTSCASTACGLAGARSFCQNGTRTCSVVIDNPFTGTRSSGELAQDVISVLVLDQHDRCCGRREITNILFVCAPPSLFLPPFPAAVKGIAGFGDTPTALPKQLAASFGLPPEFALCLASNGGSGGGILFGSIPTELKLHELMNYAPLSIGQRGEYMIPVTSININDKKIPSVGPLSAKISTTAPYPILEHFLFTSITDFFAAELAGVPRKLPLPPFGLCFDSRFLPARIPDIELVLNGNAKWVVPGVDAIIKMRPEVSCLGFVHGGIGNSRSVIPAVTIGASLLEGKLLHFDLARSRIGFAASRLSQPFNCSGFIYGSTIP